MNEKRFITIDHSTCVFDKITKEEYVCIDREEAFLVCKRLNEQQATIEQLKRRLDYETRMHKRWKDDCLAILEEQDLNDYVKELQKSKKSGWDSEPNTDYVTRVKEGLK